MNKLLLLALILLLGVLAFGMGLFSNDRSASLSQYVPDSVGQLFSKTTESKTAQENNSRGISSLPTLVMPEYSTSNNVVKKEETIAGTEPVFEGFGGMSGSLIQELQQEFTPDMNKKPLEDSELNVEQVEAENTLLKNKVDALSAELDNRSTVLKQIEKQIKKLSN